MATPFKRKILDVALTDLRARRELYQKGPHYKAAIRNPAFVIMKWDDGNSQLPVDTVKWNETYRQGSNSKPSPILDSVTITLNTMANTQFRMEAEFQVKIFTRDDFTKIFDSLCKYGMLLSFTWGYSDPYGDGYTSGRTIKGFKLSIFTFNMEADGTYIINGKATGPAPGIGSLNANFQIKDQPVRKYKVGNESYDVTGIVELLTFWAQGNGEKSIDKMEDGEVLKVPDSTCSDGTKQDMGNIVVFDSGHLHNKGLLGAIGSMFTSDDTNETSKTNNIIYISLETLVGLFNSEVLPQYAKSLDGVTNVEDISKLKILFDSDGVDGKEGFSYSYLDKSIRSAYPTKVLLFNDKLGNYKNKKKKGKNYWEDVKNKAAVKSDVAIVEDKYKIDLKKIYIERSVILKALQGTYKQADPASTIDNKSNKEATVNISEFFTQIFGIIKEVTGDRIALNLIMHPAVFDGSEKEAYNLYVVDESSGYLANKLPVWVFNPIDGDGITRSFSIKGEVGGQNYQMSQFKGMNTTTDVGAYMDNVDKLLEVSRAARYSQALKEIEKVLYDPGALGDSAFDEIHMQSLKSQFVVLQQCEPQKKKMRNLGFVGLGCDVDLDGIWGIGPGCGIWSTQMPDKYRENQIYFFVSRVTHQFTADNSDWSTKIEGQINVTYEVEYL